jgi:transcriptional regulator with XRE-family HTH domain
MADSRSTITESVRRLLRESGQSQYEICLTAGVDKGALSRFMAGQRGLSLATLDRLAEAMGWGLVATSPRASRKKKSIRSKADGRT